MENNEIKVQIDKKSENIMNEIGEEIKHSIEKISNDIFEWHNSKAKKVESIEVELKDRIEHLIKSVEKLEESITRIENIEKNLDKKLDEIKLVNSKNKKALKTILDWTKSPTTKKLKKIK